ncbi:MAG: large conductance mechanosensitive channel protein MscL [Clostridia bacterium]|nr:large conductance mechanosensitive channel protein MscL [Clostridia bacterium]
MKNFVKEFKEFITKGNVMTMAVGIIIGGAFTAIINSLVADVIGPIIGLILGGKDFSALSFGIGDAQIMYGNFINAIITFILTAIVLFFIVKAFNKFENLKKKEEAEEEAPAEPEPSDEAKLLTEIRDLLKK